MLVCAEILLVHDAVSWFLEAKLPKMHLESHGSGGGKELRAYWMIHG